MALSCQTRRMSRPVRPATIRPRAAIRGAMRAVVQRASAAAVVVDGQVVGALSRPGLVVLLGVTHTDTPEDAARLARKIWELRILADERSAADLGAPILVISQFTL